VILAIAMQVMCVLLYVRCSTNNVVILGLVLAQCFSFVREWGVHQAEKVRFPLL
jgi:hypothetical protein